MATVPRDTVILTTPRGHEVMAELDYEHFEIRRAKVINHYTGVMKSLDPSTAQTLARALKARSVYEHAISETKAVEGTLRGFGKLAEALGNDHPAMEPYWKEAAQHRAIAKDMRLQARHFHDHAMAVIDRIAGD